ncbi:MAG: rod shape-determining protein MreC [Bacteroidales bacterium]|jgi:rod shape-determining protein MreC|nr:rod shape-determining protein MreC [Bacteroidales bacterium]
MRNLYLFLLKAGNIFLFILLIGVCIVMLYWSSGYNRWVINSAVKEVTSPALKIREMQFNRFRIKATNSVLIEQNRQLLNKAYNHTIYSQTEDKLQSKDFFTYITAGVVDNSLFLQNNYLILDKGSNDGVKPDMGVVTADGVVGIVKEVSPNFCTVLSLLHSEFKLSAKIYQKDISGIVAWDGNNYAYARITNLSTTENIRILDTVVTVNSLIFPENYPIGIIFSTQDKIQNGYSSLKIKLLASFNQLNTVYIVKQNYIEEINQLKERSENAQ